MKDSGGNWLAQPPAYDPIVAEGKYNNIKFTRCGFFLFFTFPFSFPVSYLRTVGSSELLSC